jgi:hypothetical protein
MARRHQLSLSFLYNEIAAGRLRARKAGSATIVTEQDEDDWLQRMPVLGPVENNDEGEDLGDNNDNPENSDDPEKEDDDSDESSIHDTS